MRAPTDPPPESAGEDMQERRGRTDLEAAGREYERTATAAVEGLTAEAKTAAASIRKRSSGERDGGGEKW